jgi:flagellar assembly protein FliH
MSDPIDDPKAEKGRDKSTDKDPLLDDFGAGAGDDFASLGDFGDDLGKSDFADIDLGTDDALPSLDDLAASDKPPALDDLSFEEAPEPITMEAEDAPFKLDEELAAPAKETETFSGFSLDDQPPVEGFGEPSALDAVAENELPADPLAVSGPLSVDEASEEFPLSESAGKTNWPEDDGELTPFGDEPSLADLAAHTETLAFEEEAEAAPAAPLVRKYMFDNSFDPVEVVPEPERVEEAEPQMQAEPEPDPEPEPPPPPPPPTFSEEELAAARAVAYADGEAAGTAQAQQSAEMKLARSIEAIGSALPGIMNDRDQAVQAIARESARLAHALVAKALPELNRRYGLTEIEAIVKADVALAIDQPRIIVRVASDLASSVEQRFEAIALAAGFQGRVIVLGDPALGPADVKLDWGDGGAERLAARVWTELTAIVARAVENLEKTAPVDQHSTPNRDIGSAA